MTQKQKITIKDVARQAGCGIATASRVLNNSGPASSEVRERVEAAARELGFWCCQTNDLRPRETKVPIASKRI